MSWEMEIAHDNRAIGGLRTVALVEDDIEVRDLIAILFQLDGRFEIVAEAGDGASGVEAVRIHQPSAVGLDLHLPVLPGTAALPALRSASPPPPHLVFSAVPAPLPPPG